MRLLLAVALLWPSLASAETLSQLITDARVLALDASSPTRQRFSDAQVTEFINQGQRQALSATDCLYNSFSFSLTPGATFYSLPGDFEKVIRVVRMNYGYMTELTPAALDGRSRGWETASGSPTYYFLNFSSRGLMGFAPWPATASDTDTIKVYYVAHANEMSSGVDIPFNGVGEFGDFHHMLAYWAAAIMSQIDQVPNTGKAYSDLYWAQIKEMKDNCKDRPNYLPSAAASP